MILDYLSLSGEQTLMRTTNKMALGDCRATLTIVLDESHQDIAAPPPHQSFQFYHG